MPNAPIPSQRPVQRPLVLLILSLWLPLSFPAMRQPAPPAGGNRMGPAEAEPWRCCRSIRVEEMGEAIPGFVRAGRPRSRVEPALTRSPASGCGSRRGRPGPGLGRLPAKGRGSATAFRVRRPCGPPGEEIAPAPRSEGRETGPRRPPG